MFTYINTHINNFIYKFIFIYHISRFRVESKRPGKREEDPEIKPFKRRIKGVKKSQEPPTVDYILQALVISGCDLPSFGILTSQTLLVKISIGKRLIIYLYHR